MVRYYFFIFLEVKMDDSCCSPKEKHLFRDYLYWHMMGSIPILTACIGVGSISLMGLLGYILFCLAIAGLLMRFFCTHCPHYIQGDKKVRCMFFWGIPKFFKSVEGPLSLKDKIITILLIALFVLIPLFWLHHQPALLIIYILSFCAFGVTIRRYECHRCVYTHCPLNALEKE